MVEPKRIAVAVSAALALSSGVAHAVLERVGPPSDAPSVGGYPVWYQDTTGLALEFCDPKNQSEVDGGWCLLLPGDVVVPEVFPTNFFDEHFYFAASASATTATGARALLVLAEEAAFAVGPARPGDQVTFSRIRMVLNPVPVSGTYRFIHPYGEDSFEAVAGDKIFFTDDIGINCAPGTFDCAMNSRLGPFLLPSATPGGAEMPALTAVNQTPDTDPAHFGGVFAPTPYPSNGKAYIADPARIGPVTGSPLPNFIDSTGASRNHNIFRVEGPPGSGLGLDPVTGARVDYVETTDFALMGRLFTGALPGRVQVDRASYARNASGVKLDVFATAFDTTQVRLPSQPKPATVQPQMTFYAAACAGVVDALGGVHPPYSAPVGVVENQMFNAGNSFWGQTNPAAIPAAVCVKDASARDAAGNTVPVFAPHIVTDDVTITQATYDPATGTLTVAATSSDTVAPPALTMAYGTYRGDMVNGQIALTPMLAAPAKIRVLSSAFGANESQVITASGAPTPAAVPVATNDSWTFPEDSAAQNLAVLANDTNATGGTVAITSAPRIGTALVNADGTVKYTPNLNAFGTDTFAYTVTVGTQVSNTATVTLNITPVNDPPVAVNDTANAVMNWVRSINVIANDTDPDGATDIANAVIVTQPATGATVSGGAGGIVSFTATKTGTFSFTYRAQDASGASSANTATVTVQVAAAEQVNFSRADYTRSSSRLRLVGTVSPAMSQTVSVVFLNSAGSVLGDAGTATTDALGNWTIDKTIALPTGAVSVRATSSNNTVRSQSLSIK